MGKKLLELYSTPYISACFFKSLFIHLLLAGINAGEVLIYALNYNVLQIKSGMAGVAYAN